MFLPQLIVAGKVYKAVPPLYSINQKGKKGQMYFTEQVDVTRYYQKSFAQKYTIQSSNNHQILSPRELTVFLMNNSDLVYQIEHVAHTWAIHPELLELVLVHQFIQKKSFADLKKVVKAKYRFMDVSKTNGIITLDGTIDKSNRFYLVDRLLDDCQPIIDILKENITFEYIVNGNVSSVYQIAKAFADFMPSNLQRYKGLGEMDTDDLFESTMNPETRTLIRYTMDSAMSEIEAIRDYESAKNFSKILDLVGDINREDLLG